jgi:hypothetical protein
LVEIKFPNIVGFGLIRHRHLLNDLYALLPHSRKDVKLDTKTKLYQLNELAELYNCNNVMFFEARKGKDLYIWMSKAPNGPTVKMHALNSEYLICSSGSSFALELSRRRQRKHLGAIEAWLTYSQCFFKSIPWKSCTSRATV